MHSNFISNMMMFWFVLGIIGIAIFIALIIAIFEMNSNIKSIKDYLLRNDFIDGRKSELREEWIYEDKKKIPILNNNNKELKISDVIPKSESIWSKKIF